VYERCKYEHIYIYRIRVRSKNTPCPDDDDGDLTRRVDRRGRHGANELSLLSTSRRRLTLVSTGQIDRLDRCRTIPSRLRSSGEARAFYYYFFSFNCNTPPCHVSRDAFSTVRGVPVAEFLPITFPAARLVKRTSFARNSRPPRTCDTRIYDAPVLFPVEKYPYEFTARDGRL